MKVTLKQIAERTGVSINTVSMVLRGMSGISAPTRERVRRAAEEMGYRRQLKPAATKQSLCLVSAERHRRDSYSYTEFNRIFMSYAAAHEFSVVTAEASRASASPEVRCSARLFLSGISVFGSPATAPVLPCRRKTNGLICFRASTARRRKTASCGIWSRIKACRRCSSAETTCLP